MEKIVLNLLKLQNQLRILHWQSNTYAQHEAYGKAYEGLDGLIDTFVEIHQGKHGKVKLTSPVSLELYNFEELDIQNVLEEVATYLSTAFTEIHDPVKDTDCLNVRDEILSVINKLKYLLTLQ